MTRLDNNLLLITFFFINFQKNDSKESGEMQESNFSIEYLNYHNSIIFIITKTITRIYKHTVTKNMAYKLIISSGYGSYTVNNDDQINT